jgi:phosphatidylinositol alpha-1,6-mannosyltransferase
VATNLSRYRAEVMVAPGAPPLSVPTGATNAGSVEGAEVTLLPIYGHAGSYAPALRENARAASFLLFRSRASLFHFVFAPNPRTSTFGALCRRVRRIPIVQTVASPPRRFAAKLFFGHALVAQSTWTKRQIESAFSSEGRPTPEIHVVPPPIGEIVPRARGVVARTLAPLLLPEGAPLFVYPGDLEALAAVETVARAVAVVTRALPTAVVVFACRPKTREAPRIERELASRLDGARVRFVREIDLLALYARATAILFPVEELTGKVDLPIALLEAMRLGVPVVACDRGPLADLEGVLRVRPGDSDGLGAAAVELATNTARCSSLVAEATRYVERRHDARAVARAYEGIYAALLEERAAP